LAVAQPAAAPTARRKRGQRKEEQAEQIARSGVEGLTIGDDFTGNTFSGNSGAVNRWPTSWVENDKSSSLGVNAGNVQVTSGAVTLKYVSGSSWSTLTNRAAIARVVNLHALKSPYLSFTQTVTGLNPTDATLEIRYSTSNAAIGTDAGWSLLMTTTANGEVTTSPDTTATCTRVLESTYKCMAQLPNAAQTGYTKIRLRANSAFTTTQSVAIDDVKITNSTGDDVSYDPWCQYSSSFPSTSAFTGGFHCLGPTLNFSLGGTFIVDTSGGSLSWYYNDPSDIRGAGLYSPRITPTPPDVGTVPVILMTRGATLQHVNCSTMGIPPLGTVPPSDNCDTPIPGSVYSVVGEQDMFNIFGRDTSPGGPGSASMQWIQIGSFANTSTSPGKIAGAWFYMPYGSIYLIANQCDGSNTVTVDFNDPDAWNFGGRLWMRQVVPCGTNYFRVPPSSSSNLEGLLGLSTIGTFTGDVTFVSWNSFDWVARAAISSRINSSL
jgi:hypothetical protein